MKNKKENTTLAVIGGGPSGLTTALLLAQEGHTITVFEKEQSLGGLWAARLDGEGYFESENSCKVYQDTYKTAPAIFELIGTRWQQHFIARHDLKAHWLHPFMADCSIADLRRFAVAMLLNILGLKSYRKESVYDFMKRKNFSQPCQEWMRATALGGITGTMRMTMWELFHRIKFNLSSMFVKSSDRLYWNKQPPNTAAGFVTIWKSKLEALGVRIRLDTEVISLTPAGQEGENPIALGLSSGEYLEVKTVFLATPPPAIAKLLENSHSSYRDGWGFLREQLSPMLEESIYEHLGITWFFNEELQNDLPLGGHGVRCGWYPILVQYSQYAHHLPPQIKTAVVGSISLNTRFRHHRLGSLAKDHEPEELAKIIWEDEQRADPTLPDPSYIKVYGLSAATQIVHHGVLSVKNEHAPLYLATNLNGQAPYFTASLESAIQAGNAAARCFDPEVILLPQ